MMLIGLYVFAVRVLVVSGPEKNLILFFFSVLGGVAWMGLVMIGTCSREDASSLWIEHDAGVVVGVIMSSSEGKGAVNWHNARCNGAFVNLVIH